MPEPRWLLLVHQLPPRPLYLRAKVRQRLALAGALPLKNSVYALPWRDDCLEDLQWIAEEAAAGGGEAFVAEARFLAGVDAKALPGRFNALREADYRRLLGELRRAARAEPAVLARWRRRLEEIAAVDFFGAPGRKEAERAMTSLESRSRSKQERRGGRARPAGHPELRRRTWVTRRHPKVDRLASAWLIRRFVDPAARFRFVDPKQARLRPREIGFDMAGGRFSHEGERCTFETLLARLSLDEPVLRAIAEIVHDIDLKEARFARPETEGVRALVEGLVRSQPDDARRLERGIELFEGLYHSLRARGPRP